MNELQLIEGCRKGERRAQKELYDAYSRKMMGVCLRYVNDRETARDLLQDGFVKIFTSMVPIQGVVHLRGGCGRSLLIVRWNICESRMCCVKRPILTIRRN